MSHHSATAGESDGIEPELGDASACLDVYMGRLGSVAGVEEEPKPPDAKDRRHRRSSCRLRRHTPWLGEEHQPGLANAWRMSGARPSSPSSTTGFSFARPLHALVSQRLCIKPTASIFPRKTHVLHCVDQGEDGPAEKE